MLIQANVIENFTCQRQAVDSGEMLEKVRDFMRRYKGGLDEKANDGDDILAGRATLRVCR
jgi:hypothetical protein